ncbi:MAG: MMPL family transporter [Metallosphaera sp.]|uniref:MMPL family transporter n=2 Tax=Metallosphaera sp. TaxID=2020860 RepID=UPI0031668135
MRGVLVLWILLMIALAPIVLQVQNFFVYSDSPFLSPQYKSVIVSEIMKTDFNISQSSVSNIYIIINGSYNESLRVINDSLKYLNEARLLTPSDIISSYQQLYFNGSENSSIEKDLIKINQLYLNLTSLRERLLLNISEFMFQLNVTYGLPLGKHVSANSTLIETFRVYYFIALENYSQINASRIAGYLTFKDPYLIFFGFNNYTNETLAKHFLEKFDNYSYLIFLLTGKHIPDQTFGSSYSFFMRSEQNASSFPVSLSNFHRNDSWLFIVQVPSNESLNNVNEFIDNIKAEVTGHLPIYARSELYTESNLKVIDLVTFTLVGILLILLLRSLVPILLLLGSAILGIEIAYSVLIVLHLFGYKIYYISGLVIPPIIFGITIDYSLLFIYRYFEEIRRGRQNPLNEAFRTAGKAAIFSGLSITLAFLSFLISPSPILKNIGIALVAGSLSSLFPSISFTYTSLRSIGINVLSFPQKHVPNPSDGRSKYLRFMINHSIKRKYYVLLTIFVVSIFSLWVFSTHNSNVDVNEIVPSTSEVVVGLNDLNNYFNYSLDYVIVPGSLNQTHNMVYMIAKKAISMGALVYSPVSLGKIVLDNSSAILNQFYSNGFSLMEIYIPYPVFSNGAINFTNWLISQGLLVGGSNAQRIDIVTNTVQTYYSFTLPLTIIFILIYLGFLLKSIAVPVRLTLSLLFSSLVGVAVMYSVFGTVYWLSPLIVFALLFSLGIDYDMFIVLRIREEEGSEDEKIRNGVEKTGLVVTAAGLILSGAFFSLMAADMQFLREIGFAVGFTILFDTFIVRPFVVPAVMSILGKYNWWPGVRSNRSKT